MFLAANWKTVTIKKSRDDSECREILARLVAYLAANGADRLEFFESYQVPNQRETIKTIKLISTAISQCRRR
jgi:hypothetical protein